MDGHEAYVLFRTPADAEAAAARLNMAYPPGFPRYVEVFRSCTGEAVLRCGVPPQELDQDLEARRPPVPAAP
eukprot:5663743-Alexandrium_andersonii.AAC.1